MINKIVIVCYLGICLFSVVNGERHWYSNSEEELAVEAGHPLRHRQHHTHAEEDVTQGFYIPKNRRFNVRHLSHQYNHHYPTTTTTTSTTTTTTTPATPVLEEHRLRHSNKLYQPYASIEERDPVTVWRRAAQTKIPSNAYSGRSININSKKHNTENFYNVSTVMKNRYFDSDGLYTRSRSAGTTLAPPLPPQIRHRHPYDILKIPYKDRILPIKKSNTYTDWDDDDNMWNNNFNDDDDSAENEDLISWDRSSKRASHLIKSNEKKSKLKSDANDELQNDYHDDNDDDDDNGGGVGGFDSSTSSANRKLRNSHHTNNENMVSLVYF